MKFGYIFVENLNSVHLIIESSLGTRQTVCVCLFSKYSSRAKSVYITIKHFILYQFAFHICITHNLTSNIENSNISDAQKQLLLIFKRALGSFHRNCSTWKWLVSKASMRFALNKIGLLFKIILLSRYLPT